MFFSFLSCRSLRLDTSLVCFSVFVHYYGQHAACNHYVTFTNPCEHMLTAGFQSVPMWAFFDSALSVSQSMYWQPSHRCSLSPLCDRMRRSWHGCSCVRCLVSSAPSIVNALLLPLFFRVCSDADLYCEVFTPTGPQQWIGNLYSCKSMWFMRYLRAPSLTVGMLTLGAHEVQRMSPRMGAPG